MRIVLPGFRRALAATPALAAVDARTQEGLRRKPFRLAYSYIDSRIGWRAGKINAEEYGRRKIRITWKMLDKGDNHNYAPDGRKVDRAFAAIETSQPSPQDIAETAAYCRGFLRL